MLRQQLPVPSCADRLSFFPGLGNISIHSPQGRATPSGRLNEVDLINCGKCRYLPTLGNLPFLHSVSLRGMHGVRRISKELYDEGTERPFPSLRKLVLDDFPNYT